MNMKRNGKRNNDTCPKQVKTYAATYWRCG